jgi:hypothetical protein
VCAGKSASASSRYGDPWGNPQTPLTSEVNMRTDGGNCFIAGDTSDSNWWRVDLGSPGFELSNIKYRTRNDSPTSGQGYNLQIIMQDEVRCSHRSGLLKKRSNACIIRQATPSQEAKTTSSPQLPLTLKLSRSTLSAILENMTTTSNPSSR